MEGGMDGRKEEGVEGRKEGNKERRKEGRIGKEGRKEYKVYK